MLFRTVSTPMHAIDSKYDFSLDIATLFDVKIVKRVLHTIRKAEPLDDFFPLNEISKRAIIIHLDTEKRL